MFGGRSGRVPEVQHRDKNEFQSRNHDNRLKNPIVGETNSKWRRGRRHSWQRCAVIWFFTREARQKSVLKRLIVTDRELAKT